MQDGSGTRCATIGVTATAGLGGVIAMVWPSVPLVSGSGPATFDDLLVGGCSVAALAAAGWLWAGAVITAIDVARRGRQATRRRGVPRALRSVVLLACGVAVAGAGGPAAADPASAPAVPAAAVARAPSTVGWLADALTSARPTTPTSTPAITPATPVVVRPGDTLWALAAGTLPRGADTGQVTAQWHRLHQLNRDVIGDDPDLIHPRQRLRVPPSPQEGPH